MPRRSTSPLRSWTTVLGVLFLALTGCGTTHRVTIFNETDQGIKIGLMTTGGSGFIYPYPAHRYAATLAPNAKWTTTPDADMSGRDSFHSSVKHYTSGSVLFVRYEDSWSRLRLHHHVPSEVRITQKDGVTQITHDGHVSLVVKPATLDEFLYLFAGLGPPPNTP